MFSVKNRRLELASCGGSQPRYSQLKKIDVERRQLAFRWPPQSTCHISAPPTSPGMGDKLVVTDGFTGWDR